MGGPLEVQAALGAAPGLDPGSQVSAGLSANSMHEAVGQATAALGFATAIKEVDTLHKMSWSQQRTVWNAATKNQQAQWLSAGYQKPPDANGGGFSFGGLLHDVAHYAGDVLGAGQHIPGVNTVLNDLGAPLRFAQHLPRAVHVLSEMGMSQQQLAGASGGGVDPFAGWRDIFSPSAWSQAWRETANGEKSFDPAVLRQIETRYDPHVFRLARQIASKVPESEIVQSYRPELRSQIVAMMNTPEVKQAAMQLDNAHMSPGKLLVGEKFLSDHPAIGHIISGGIDLAYDIASDPTMKLGKVAGLGGDYAQARWGLSNAMAAKYAASDTTAYQMMLKDPGVQRYIQTIGDIIEKQGVSAAERYDPRLLKFYNQFGLDPRTDTPFSGLSEAGVHDAQSFGDYLASEAGKAAILSGRAATVTHSGVILPHLSSLGWARMEAKGHMAQAINWAAENVKGLPREPLTHEDLVGSAMGSQAVASDALKTLPHSLDLLANPDTSPYQARIGSPFLRPIGSVARMVRQLTTITADAPAVDVTAADAAVNVKRVLSYSLPAHQVNEIVDAFAMAPDVGTKFTIYKGAVAQMLHHAGAFDTEKGTEAAGAILDTIDRSLKSEVYSPGGYDLYEDGSRSGLLDNQMSNTLALPSFKSVRQAARRERFYNGLGVSLADTMDKFMERWKQAVLMRPGFAVRVSSDEASGFALRNGLIPYLLGRIAVGDAKNATERAAAQAGVDAALVGKDDIDGKIMKAIAAITSHVPAPILSMVKTPADLAKAAYGHTAWTAYKISGHSGLTRQMVMDSAGDIHEGQLAGRAFHDHISSLAHAGGGYDEASEIRNLWVDGTPLPLRLKQGGRWSETNHIGELFREKWSVSLEQLATSKIAQAIMRNIDAPLHDQVQAAKEVIESDDMALMRSKAKRNNVLGDGRVVGVDATQDEAHTEWAQKAVSMVHHLVRSSDPVNGPILRDIVDKMLTNGHSPSIETLAKVKNADLPDSAFSPEYAALGTIDNMVQKGFNHLSTIIDWMGRKPIFIINHAQAKQDLAPWVKAMVGTDSGDGYDRLLNDMATHRAFEAVKPYIHNPEVRSQFEVIHRTAFPFLFAQDQFVKRWARTFIDNPSAIRKAQLGMNGLRTSGIVHQDQNGNDVFTYPGSAFVTKTLAEALSAMHISSAIPVGVPFTGEVKNMMPGLNNPLSPSTGPAVSIPVKALADHFPELQPAEQALLAQGANQTWWEQILPTTLNRTIQAVAGNQHTTSEFASAMMKAIQMMYENGQGLPPKATSDQRQQFIDRVQATTRIVFFMKAALGFVAPASPTPDFDPKNLNPRLRTLLGELPYDQAITQFMKEHPDASAYTVFGSSSTGNVPNLPSTTAAGNFLTSNARFVSAFPKAAGWFIPRTIGTASFDPAVYRQQIQYAMRQEKLPAQFLADVQKAPAASVYFQSVKNEQAALAQAQDAMAKAQIRSSFDQWKATFMGQNPALADYLTAGSNAPKRVATIREIQTALNSSTVPQTPQADHIKTLMQSWENYEQIYLSTQGNSSSQAADTRRQAKEGFTAWADQFTKDNPDVLDLWNVLLKPEMGTAGLTGGLA